MILQISAPHEDGSFSVDGTAFVRDINKIMGWQLPTDGPKSISGMLVEHLETIPDAPACVAINQYRFEIIENKDNTIKSARVTLNHHHKTGNEDE